MCCPEQINRNNYPFHHLHYHCIVANIRSVSCLRVYPYDCTFMSLYSEDRLGGQVAFSV